MDRPEEFDAERLRARIHENMQKRTSALDGPAPAVRPESAGGVDEADLALLRASADVTDVPHASHRMVLGSLVLLAKKIVRKLLTPVLSRQTAYNAANLRLIELNRRELVEIESTLHEMSERHARAMDAIEGLVRRQHAEGQEARAEIREHIQAQSREQSQALARLQQRVAERDERVDALTARLQDELRRVSRVVETLGSRQAELQARVDGTHGPALQTAREHIARAERKLRRIQHALGAETDAGPTSPAPGLPPVRMPEPDFEFDYAGFEERFRGSEETTRARQSLYLEDFRKSESVLEIGCGRGEFLELLREVGIAGKGVDLDLDMTLYCKEKGLDVVREDALAYLESLPDDSLGGVFAAQVIEHLETPQLTRLVSLCYRKLKPGGALVLETLNPECLMVLYRWFWLDLSHTRLIHPETLKFLVESVGFARVQCRFLPGGDTPLQIPPLELPGLADTDLAGFNAATDYLNKLLYTSSDYAVTGIK